MIPASSAVLSLDLFLGNQHRCDVAFVHGANPFVSTDWSWTDVITGRADRCQPERQPAMPPRQHQPGARSTAADRDAALPAPPSDQVVRGPQLPVGQVPRAVPEQPQRAAPGAAPRVDVDQLGEGRPSTASAVSTRSPGVGEHPTAIASSTSPSSRSWSAVRASACATPPPRICLEQRQRLGAQPHPGELGAEVVRVPVRVEPELLAGLAGHRAAHVEQRPAPRRVVRRASRRATRSRTAGQPEQHRLRLIVEGVPEQHRAVGPRGVERARTGPGGRRPPARPSRSTLTVSTRRRRAAERQGAGRGLRRPPSAEPVLQPVVDDEGVHRTGLGDARPRSAPASRRHRTAPTATRRRRGRARRPSAARRAAPQQRRSLGQRGHRLRARRLIPGPGRSSVSGSSISASRGRVSGPVQTALNSVHPDPADDGVDEGLAPHVLRHLGVHPEQRADQPLQRVAPAGARRWSKALPGSPPPTGTTAGPTASITWSACPSSRVPSISSRSRAARCDSVWVARSSPTHRRGPRARHRRRGAGGAPSVSRPSSSATDSSPPARRVTRRCSRM